MANAGCINAYDCNGCLIQTLQNLDSACIGVGVQYTAPNPLDDKKIDYIKYTDKCGCTCCLTGENEILIYATNGVIKNLTLTNDDTNEAVVVKWNDIFGSNRAKTVVRYKTGSAPISPTDGTLAVEETTKNQYSTNGFSVTGLSDSTTYYFSVFALDIDGTMIDVQGMSITTSFIFAGYTRLQYIESDGNQYLNSGITPNNTIKIATKFAHNEHILNTPIFGARTYSDEYLLWSHPSEYYNGNDSNTAVLFYSDYAQTTSNPGFKRLTNYPQGTEIEFEYSKTGGKYGNQTWTWNPNSGSTSKQLYIFGLNGAQGLDTRKFSGKMRYFKIRMNNVIQREMRPVKRKSDNAVGMFDITNKVFYQNLGSGSFTPGPNYS